MMKKPFLRRYTNLPALIGILKNREITFLPPSSWDDRNDRYLMDAYKRAKKLKTLLALCFSQVSETYHHWRVFAPGSSGVSIEFDRDALLKLLPKKSIMHSPVDYKTIKQLKPSEIDENDLPFIKRAAYRDEKEFRILYSSTKEDCLTKSIPIELSTINRIAINPWLHDSLYGSIREIILSIDGCDRLDVYHSRLIESPKWMRFAATYK
jgi:hypothetical protein